MAQLALFADKKPLPQGLQYRPDFLRPAEEQALVRHIEALPFEPFQFGNYEGKRRVVFYGVRYDFTHQRLEKAADLPDWIMPYVRRTEEFAKLASGSIRHALFTEYATGAGIGWHRDKRHFDEVVGISLMSTCKFRFRRKSGDRWERFTLDAQPRSLYVMSGEARHLWEHSIPPVETLRYSVTFRTMVGAS